jgi:hypothetical protein
MMADKPFTRGGITYPSQYAYRQAAAQRLGYDSVHEHRKSLIAARDDQTFRPLVHSLQGMSATDKSRMQAILWNYKATLGESIPGKKKKVSADLSDLIDEMEDRLGRRPYLIWRWLYA